MLRSALVLVLATTAISAQQRGSVPQPAAPSAVTAERTARGRLTAAANGAALPRVRVSTVVDGSVRAVFTDDTGHFAISLPPSARALTASKAGYAAVTVALPRDAADAVDMQLERGSAISGRVTDPNGAPMIMAPIAIRRTASGRETAAVLPSFETTTDDLGEYRIGGLAAGRYTVSAANPRLDGVAAVSPSTRLASSSQVIDLRAADEAYATNLVIAPVLPSTNPFADLSVLRGRLAAIDIRGAAGLRGRVLTEQGEPIAGAAITVFRAGTPVRRTATDARGDYIVLGLAAGEFVVEAGKPGFVTRQHGQLRAEPLGTPITLRERAQTGDIDVMLPRGSVVTGIVMDENGEVMANVAVDVLQLRTDGNRLAARRAGTTRRTDDYGRYRLFGLTPGRYLLRASVDEEMTGADGRPVADGYAPVYFPGSTSADEASPVTLGIGQDSTGLNLVFARMRVARVSGRVADAGGMPIAGTVTLAVSQRSAGIALGVREVSTSSAGTFSIGNVPPGEYVVQAQGRVATDDGELPRADAAAAMPEFGVQFVTVRDRDPAPVTIQTSPPSSIAGRVMILGRPPSYTAEIDVRAQPADADQSPVNSAGRSVAVNRDLSFRLDGLTGPTRLTLGRSAESWYVRSILIGGRETRDVPFNFGLQHAVHTSVTIVVSAAGAEISGQVVDERDQVVEGAAVVVFATARNRWYQGSDSVNVVRPNGSGVFRVTGLPPGAYWVAAVDALEGSADAGDWSSPLLLQTLTATATQVAVGEGALHTGRFRISRR